MYLDHTHILKLYGAMKNRLILFYSDVLDAKISIFYFAEFSMADNIHGKMGYTYPNPILLNEVSDTVILLIHSINVLSSIYYNTIPHTQFS